MSIILGDFDGFSLHTRELGDATLRCHIYATVDQASLFPADQPSSTVKRLFTVQ
jgi:hypothetical protein